MAVVRGSSSLQQNLSGSGSPQVNHGCDVWALGTVEPESYDAMVTDQTGVVLAAPGADCMPILFVDPGSKVIAVAHAGASRAPNSDVGQDVEKKTSTADCEQLFLRLERDPAGCCYGNRQDHGYTVWLPRQQHTGGGGTVDWAVLFHAGPGPGPGLQWN